MGRKRKLCSEFDEPDGEDKPVQRNAANERERARMRVLSKAFTRLKTTLPWVPPDTKLSKLDTLRLATCYIGHLRQVLAEDEGENVADTNGSSFVHPMNLTWPFTFSGKPVGDCPGGGEQESHHDQKILMPKQDGISTLS